MSVDSAASNPCAVVLAEFLEALVHQVLFLRAVRVRLPAQPAVTSAPAASVVPSFHSTLTSPTTNSQVYQPDLFERQRLYNIAVRKAAHPGAAGGLAALQTRHEGKRLHIGPPAWRSRRTNIASIALTDIDMLS